MSLRLYADHRWDSPWVFTVFVALREKCVPFEIEVLDLERGDQRNPAFRDRAITARVPTIDHDGFVLAESTAIVEYLEEVFAPPEHPRLLPESLRERARARQLMGWLRSDLQALREARSTETMFYERAERPLDARAARDAEKLIRVTSQLLRPAATTLFEAWCIADVDLSIALQRMIINGDPVPDAVGAYARAQWQRRSVRDFLEMKRPSDS